MIEKCLLVADEIAGLDVLNNNSVTGTVGQMESLKVTRLLVTDQTGKVLYDSTGKNLGGYTLFPEIITAISDGGNDVCTWKYRNGTTDTKVATPIVYYGSIVGCVYMTEYETLHIKILREVLGGLEPSFKKVPKSKGSSNSLTSWSARGGGTGALAAAIACPAHRRKAA